MIAAKLERHYTKDEIINLYLNKYDFNYNAVGIESATRTYFNKSPGELKVEEAAVLVGMLKNSSLYNPVRRPEVTRDRRNVVLSQMRKAGHLTRDERDSLQQLPIEIDFNRSSHVDISAPYYRQHLAKIMMAKKPERKNYASWQGQQFREDSVAWIEDPYLVGATRIKSRRIELQYIHRWAKDILYPRFTNAKARGRRDARAYE